MTSRPPSSPLRRGGVVAVLAAIAFGVTTPLIQRFGLGAGSVATAVLLYSGAALASLGRSAANREAPVRARHGPRLLAIAFSGALVAPASLAFGLQRTGAVSASLLLNFEAVFTLILARILFRESMGRRASAALGLMLLGGACLVFEGHSGDRVLGVGALAVVAATLSWSLDNALTRPLAELDPVEVVRWKAGLGAAMGVALSLAMHDPFPSLGHSVALLMCGATGYGVSLRFYLLAQRQIGAARTSSIFALAPFVGAAAAWALGDRALGPSSWAAAALFGVGVYLHLTETHQHLHTHEAIEHEHAHRHDDGHHDHHPGEVIHGEHSHPHRHDTRTHDHPHAPDAHHRHGHSG